MFFDDIVNVEKMVIISPYTNLNIVLARLIAIKLADIGLNTVLYSDDEQILSLVGKGLDRSVVSSMLNCNEIEGVIIAIITKYLNLLKILSCSRYIIFTWYRFRRMFSGNVDICIARRYHSLLSLICRNRKELYVFRVDGDNVVEKTIPRDIVTVYRELREIVMLYGSIKASDFVKYIAKKYGYSRDESMEIVRKAIELGIFRYRNGYLSPGVEL